MINAMHIPNIKCKGFTLVELMIVVVVVGILGAIAYPSYIAQVRRAHQTEAKGALVELAQFMQRFYTENNRYDQDSNGNAVALSFNQSPREGADKTYNLALQAVNANSYTLQAVPINAQVGDRCGTLTLTNTGARTPANCW